MNHKLMYKKQCLISPGIRFAGPKKPYSLNNEELRVLQPYNITSRIGWSYKHTIINGYRFDKPPKNLQKALACNSVFTTSDGGLYFLDVILLIEHKGFILCRKIPPRDHFSTRLDAFVVKAGPLGRRVIAVPVANILGYKYHIFLNHAGDINFVSKLPNTREVE